MKSRKKEKEVQVLSRRRKEGKLMFWCIYLSPLFPRLEDRSSLVDVIASFCMLLLLDQV